MILDGAWVILDHAWAMSDDTPATMDGVAAQKSTATTCHDTETVAAAGVVAAALKLAAGVGESTRAVRTPETVYAKTKRMKSDGGASCCPYLLANGGDGLATNAVVRVHEGGIPCRYSLPNATGIPWAVGDEFLQRTL